MPEFTDMLTLHSLARRRGIKDPQGCKVVCGDCGAALALGATNGIIHWPDCDGDPGRILFAKQVNGAWVPQGAEPEPSTEVAF